MPDTSMSIHFLTGVDVSVFTQDGTDLLLYLQNVDIKVDPKTEDASGVADAWENDVIVKKAWSLDYELTLSDVSGAIAMSEAISDGNVDCVVHTGGGNYTGKAAMNTASHQIKKGALQTMRVSLKGRGPLVFA